MFDFVSFLFHLGRCLSVSVALIVSLWLFLFLWVFFSISIAPILSLCVHGFENIFFKIYIHRENKLCGKTPYTNERNDHKQSIMEMETKTRIIAQTIEKKAHAFKLLHKSKYLYSVHQLEFTINMWSIFWFESCSFCNLFYLLRSKWLKFATKFREIDSNFKRLVQSKWSNFFLNWFQSLENDVKHLNESNMSLTTILMVAETEPFISDVPI